jgi:chromosome segregation ATPase
LKAEFDKLNLLLKDRNAEIEKLKNDLRLKTTECDDWKLKFTNLQNEFNKMKAQYESKIAELTNSLAARDRELGDLKGRITKLESQLGSMGNQSSTF